MVQRIVDDITAQSRQLLTKPAAKPTQELTLKEYGDQLKHEIALLALVPEMKEQRKEMERKLREIKAALTAAEAGFDPYIPQKSWFVGFLHAQATGGASWRRYDRALPVNVIREYDRAKKLKIFNTFTVHSPDKEAFTEIQRAPARVDPVLVGWIGGDIHAEWTIRNSSIHENNSGYAQVWGGQGFLIAAWDLGKDLLLIQEKSKVQ